MHVLEDLDVSLDDGPLKVTPPPQGAYPTELSQQPLAEATASIGGAVQKRSNRHTPPVNPQVPPQTLKTPPASAQAQAPKILPSRTRDLRQGLPDMPPPAAEQESRDGYHHARRCLRQRGLGEGRQDRRWEFRQC